MSAREVIIRYLGQDVSASATAAEVAAKNDVAAESSAAKSIASTKKTSAAHTALWAGMAIGVAGFAAKAVGQYDTVGRETVKLERLTGGTAKEMSGLDFAAKQSNVTFQTLSGSVTKFSKSMNTDAVQTTLRGLGVATKDAHGNTLPYLDILKQLADKFEKMPPGLEKNRIAMQLFGKSGADMEPLLNKGSAGIDKLIQKGEGLGAVLTDDKAIRKQIQAQKDFQAAVMGLEVQVGQFLVPILTGASKVAAELFGAFSKLPGPIKTVVEVGGGLALTGVAVSKAWGLLKPVFEGVEAGIAKLGGSAVVSAAETSAASAEADAAILSQGAAAETSAATTTVAMGEADTAISSITVTTGEADAALASMGTAAQAAAAEIVAAAGEADTALAGVGASAGAAAGASTAAGAGAGLGLRAAIGAAAAPAAIAYLATQGGDQAPVDRSAAQQKQDNTFLAQSPAGQQKEISREKNWLGEQGISKDDAKVLSDLIARQTDLSAATSTLAGNEDGLKTAVSGVSSALSAGVAAITAHTSATRTDAEVSRDGANALGFYSAGLHSVTDPALAAVDAESALTKAKSDATAATAAVTKAEKDHGKGSDEYKKAVDDAATASRGQVDAAIAQQTALSNLAQTYNDAGKSTDDFKSTMQGLVAQGLITQDQANSMTFAFGLTAQSIKNIPAGKDVKITGDAKQVQGEVAKAKGWFDGLGTSHNTVFTADVSQAVGQVAHLALVAKGISNIAYLAILASQPKTGPGHAAGGPVQKGVLYPVNERGTELFTDSLGNQMLMPGRDGKITPNDQLKFGQKMSGLTMPKPVPMSSGTHVTIAEGAVNVTFQVTGDNVVDQIRNAGPALKREIGEAVKGALITLPDQRWMARTQ